MLSRGADNLYWMSRYLERAEHTARLLGVGLIQMLDQEPGAMLPRWQRLIAALRVPSPEEPLEPYALTRWLTFDAAQQSSILAYIGAARENARQVREQISSEMWEQLNGLYLRARGSTMEGIWRQGPVEFMQMVKESAHLFQGLTDGTMTHGEGWRFIQLGRNIERAGATAALVDVHYRPFLADPSGLYLDYSDWVALLKSCTAFEAYCKVYTAEMRPECIAEFLLLNGSFPRSVRFCADRIQQSMQAIGQITGARAAAKAERLAGRLRAALDYAQVDEVMADNMHAYLNSIGSQCAAIHSAVYQAYISYPVEAALAS